MYAVVITDEGGARRRLDFSKPELTVGRVQGNDIVLSKRNVSKQHARLSLQGDQAVVVDLNSTNGTWVNGRKITSPQPLKQGDKIYIADFIITLEQGNDGTEGASPVPRVSEPPPLPGRSSAPAESASPARRALGARRANAANPATSDSRDLPATSFPPRVERAEAGQGRISAKTEPPLPAVDPLSALLSGLAERIDIDNIDPAAMKNQERWSAARTAIAETFLAMQTDESMNAGVDMREVAHIALHEAVGLGALDDLLSDQSVRTIVVNGPAHVFVDKGEGLEAVSSKFSSDGALRRVSRRLAAQSGQILDARPVIHGRLSFGPRLTIMQPPLVMNGPVIELCVRNPMSLGELAENGWMTADAATYLSKAVAECRNIVVAGPLGAGVTEMMSALARELPETENAVVIESVPDLDIDRDRVISLTAAYSGVSLSEAIDHGTRLHAEHLVINDLVGADAMKAMAALLGREPGHLLGVQCWSTKDAIEGLVLAAGCGGAERACVAQLVGSTVDLVIAMQRGTTGRRLTGILEIQGHEGGDVSYQSVPF
jgi:pilus assembly protein CpaF